MKRILKKSRKNGINDEKMTCQDGRTKKLRFKPKKNYLLQKGEEKVMTKNLEKGAKSRN